MPGGTRGYNVWTPDEEDALRRGVKKHGLGAWEVIRKDPEFHVLENRTGVQLKDKFRNLVKFRHISQEESRSLKPKHSGPWSRKHSASTFVNERALTRTPSANDVPATNPVEERENTEEHAAALLALDAGKPAPDGDTTASDAAGANGAKKNGARPRSRSIGGFETCSDDETAGGEGGAARRKRRRSLENRSFGIYDQRRYRADGTLRTPGDDERTATESDGDEPSGRPSRQRRSNSGGRGGRVGRVPRGRGRRRYDDDSEETTTEEEDFPSDEERNDEADVQPEDDYVVDCPCGIRYDDGAMMVECESCKTWAHIDCLQYQATNNPTVVYDLNNYMCLQCQNKRNPLLAGGMVKTSKAANGPGKGRLPNGSELMLPGTDGTLPDSITGLSTRYSRDRTQEAGHVLLGLANGDPMPGMGPGLPRTGSKLSLRGGPPPGMPALPAPLASGILTAGALQTPAYLDSLSLFLAATARPNSALGPHPAGSPTSPSKMAMGGRGGVTVPRPERLTSGPLATAADRSASQQNLEKLLAAANVSLDGGNHAAGAGGGDGGGASARQPSLLSEGGAASPNQLAALRRAGSSSAAGHLSSVAALSSLARPASRGPTGQELFGDSDDDLHHSAALAQLFNQQTSNDRLLQMLASNRVATPSQMFLEQLMRGATPDINLAPLIQGAALQGAAAAAAAAAAASAQLQMLHQHGLGASAHSLLHPDPSGGMLPPGFAQALQMQAVMAAQNALGLPNSSAPGTGGTSAGGSADKAADKGRPGGLNPDELVQLAAAVSATGNLGMHPMELRPGTPDTWALLRGSTPTPDAMGLHSFGIPPLAGFPADPTWLLHRGSPALVPPHGDGQQLPAAAQLQAQAGAAPPGVAGQQGAGNTAAGAQPLKKEAADTANGTAEGAGAAAADTAPGKDGAQAQQEPAQQAQPAAETKEESQATAAAPSAPAQLVTTSAPAAAGGVAAPAAVAVPTAAAEGAPAATAAVKTEQGAAAAATALAEAAASSAAAAAARSLPTNSSAVAAVMELVDRKSSLGVLGSAGDLAAAVAACTGGNEEAYFNVEDMLRSSTPALR